MDRTTAVWMVAAVVVLVAVAGAILLRRRSARPAAPARTGYAFGEPYAADTYGTNPHGLALGPIGAEPGDDDPSPRLL